MTRMKKQLMEKINMLGCTEHNEIYQIIQSDEIKYSENNNGVFFNLTTIPDTTFEKIEKFVDYCHENKVELDEYDKKLSECKFRNSINTFSSNIMQSSINEPIDKKERWRELMDVVDKSEIVKEFVDKLSSNTERHMNKRVGTRFIMARKKYAKRMPVENDFKDELTVEQYLIEI